MNRNTPPISPAQRLLQWSGWSNHLAGYALRTTLASCFALFVGWWLGLEHPQWAAMSVWAASQPQQRGMLVEKCLFRLIGTVVGTIVGVLILYLSHGDILYIALGLTFWVTLCTGAGNLFHGQFGYLTLLSGYTASLVSLINVAQGQNIFELGIDRMLTVLLGVVVATIVGILFNKVSNEERITIRVKQLTRSVLILFTQAIRTPVSSAQVAALMKQAAEIDELLEPHSAGSLRSRRSVHSIRAIIHSNISLLTRLNTKVAMEQLRPIEDELQRLAQVVSEDQQLQTELECIQIIRRRLTDSELIAAFNDLHTALLERLRYKKQGRIKRDSLSHMVVLHRDWVAAKQAMLRTFTVLGTIGLTWYATGSAIGAFVMLGTSVMITLFSTFEAPASMMVRIMIWQCIGLAANLLTKGYFWAGASSELECVIIMLLCILPVIIPQSSTRFSIGAMDYVMIYLILSHIEYPVQFDFATEFSMGLAAISGTFVAYLGFLLIFPTNGLKRSKRIKTAILHDLQRVYQLEWESRKFAFIHARAQHRLLRLIQTDNKRNAMTSEQVAGAANVLTTIQLIGKIKEILAADILTEQQKQRAVRALDHLVMATLNRKGSDELFSPLTGRDEEGYQFLTSLHTEVTCRAG